MFLQQFIERYKKNRKQAYLNQASAYRHRYAFVGAGQHSFDNLYPILHYLAIPLKQICTLHEEHAVKMATRFPGCSGTGTLDEILNDSAVKGVFVSATPSQHFNIVKRLLSAGKNVFVEKPPCYTLQELKELAAHTHAQHCMVALQKRFGIINQHLDRYRAATVDYNYQYLTGRYPEGDELVELFIHPIDNLVYLFGEPEQVSIQESKNNRSWFMIIRHSNKVSGVLQISSDHTWKLPVDRLLVNTDTAILEASYPNTLTRTIKSPAYFNIPFEKVSKRPAIKEILVDNSNFVPGVAYNSVAAHGFLGEIEYFLKMTEQNEFDARHHLQKLAPVYTLIETLRKRRQGH